WLFKEQGPCRCLDLCGSAPVPPPAGEKRCRTPSTAAMNGAVAVGPERTTASLGSRQSPSRDVLHSKTLVLNRSFLPIHITSVRRACVMLYQGLARAVDGQYQTFDFGSWCEHGGALQRLGLVGRSMPVPRVILLNTYDRVPRRHVRFTRHNV